MSAAPTPLAARACSAPGSVPLDDEPCNALDDAPAPLRAAIEIAALAALGTAAGAGAGAGLALAFAPLLAGLRYGAGAGVACAALQTAALFTAAQLHVAQLATAPTGAVILGWLIAGLVPGQFCDAWTRRVRRLERCARDAGLRLGTLARAYHLAIASHDQLQRELPGSPSSLRDALEALARELRDAPDPCPLDAAGERILALLRTHAAVRAASLHPVDAAGRIGPAIALLGRPTAPADDPLLREAVRRGEVVSVRDVPLAVTALVAIPLVDVRGRVHAAVAVHELPFLFLHQDTLTLFAVLGGHLGDLVARRAAARTADAPATRALCTRLGRALGEARRLGIPGALAVIELTGTERSVEGTGREGPETPDRRSEGPLEGDGLGGCTTYSLRAAPSGERSPRLLASFLAAQRRITDDAEVIVGDDGILRVVAVLALTGAPGLRSYLARLDELARTRAHELGIRCDVRLRGWTLHDAPLPRDPRELPAALATLLREADPSSETSTSRRRHGLVA